MGQRYQGVDASVESEHATVLLAYVLHLGGSIAAVPSLIGLSLNYLKRSEADQALMTHHVWMTRTFWWALAWLVLGALTTAVFVGWLVIGIVWIWYVYRQLLGMIRLANGESMAVPARPARSGAADLAVTGR